MPNIPNINAGRHVPTSGEVGTEIMMHSCEVVLSMRHCTRTQPPTYARRAKVANGMLRTKLIQWTSQWSDCYKLVPAMVLHTSVHVQPQRSDVQHISCIEDLSAVNVM